MTEAQDIIADNGDVWRVRPCDECDGVVVERWLTTTPTPGVERTPADEPTQALHVPADVAAALARALTSEAT